MIIRGQTKTKQQQKYCHQKFLYRIKNRSVTFCCRLLLIVGFFSFCTTLLSGCIADYGYKRKKTVSPSLVDKNINFEKEIIRIERTLAVVTGKERAKATLNLAILYSHHENTSPDYMRAYKRLKKYILLVPESEIIVNQQYLLSLLNKTQNINRVYRELKNRDENFEKIKKVDRNRKETIKRLKKENEILIKKQAVMESEYKKLMDETGKLKDLDLRLEQMWRKIQ